MRMGSKKSTIEERSGSLRRQHVRAVGVTVGMAAAAAAALMAAVVYSGPAKSAEVAAAPVAVREFVKPELETASKGKVLMVVSEDFPNFAKKVFLKTMSEKGVRADIVVSPNVPKQKAAFFIDGKLYSMSIAGAPQEAFISFADIGGALHAIESHIKTTRAAVTGPVASL